MAGRKPVEKRLMNIEDGISKVMDKLCQMQPCEVPDDADASEQEQEE